MITFISLELSLLYPYYYHFKLRILRNLQALLHPSINSKHSNSSSSSSNIYYYNYYIFPINNDNDFNPYKHYKKATFYILYPPSIDTGRQGTVNRLQFTVVSREAIPTQTLVALQELVADQTLGSVFTLGLDAGTNC